MGLVCTLLRPSPPQRQLPAIDLTSILDLLPAIDLTSILGLIPFGLQEETKETYAQCRELERESAR